MLRAVAFLTGTVAGALGVNKAFETLVEVKKIGDLDLADMTAELEKSLAEALSPQPAKQR